ARRRTRAILPGTAAGCAPPVAAARARRQSGREATLQGSSRRRTLQGSIRREVLPDLLEDLRIDHSRVLLLRLLLRREYEPDLPALRYERARIEHVEAFVDRIALGDAP